jgi:serine/threonine-protein kinase PknG
VARCDRPDCGLGDIDDQGFCDECDRRPLAAIAPPAAAPPERPAPGGGADAAPGAARVRPDPWWGLDLVTAQPPPEPVRASDASQEYIGEAHRRCAAPACRRPVGRGHDGRPGRLTGYCPACGTPFDFTRPAEPQVVAGRYEVIRSLGSGSFGAAYLVRDRNLETEVVIKALTNTSVAATAEQERDALVGLRHDSIVRILNYEPDGPYLVLEHVPGEPLSARAGDSLDVVLAHGIQILQALDYLHARGLLHCDVKPSNIIRFREVSPVGPRDRVRLIDFGSVRRLGAPGPVTSCTEEYAPPLDDPEHVRPTAGFDLFCLGRTLQVLCRRRLKDRTAPGTDSLALLLSRATDRAAPERRFVSARQFAEQLSGVIRQVVAERGPGRRVVRASTLFGPMNEPLDGGLGAPRPLDDWKRAEETAESPLVLGAPFRTPAGPEAAAALPAPPLDPDYPLTPAAQAALTACGLALRRAGAGDTGGAGGAGNARDAGDFDELDTAARALAAAPLPAGSWLADWYHGLIALARDDVATAATRFTAVRAALPGELIPRLALGLCAELRADNAEAERHYAAAFGTSPGLGAAGFGLARVRARLGRRDEAVDVALRLAKEYRFERRARVAAMRLRVSVIAPRHPADPGRPAAPARAAAPTQDDLLRARTQLLPNRFTRETAAALLAEIEYAEFVRTGDRLKLSEAVRRLAEHVPTEREAVALVDLANRLRPPLRWRWSAKPWRTR